MKKKGLNEKIKIVFAFFLGAFIFGGGVYAATLLNSSEVAYNNGSSSVTNVKDALDELYRRSSSCSYEVGQTWDFDYTGDIQIFVASCAGNYKVEAWGAQGGTANTTGIGGAGGYSTGQISLEANKVLFINVGGVGNDATYTTSGKPAGGYNGGGTGSGYCSNFYGAAGGGATHIAFDAGLLSSLETKTNKIILVAGGGGGGGYDTYLDTRAQKGGYGGGYEGGQGEISKTGGSPATVGGGGGTQSAGGTAGQSGATGSFGTGATSPNTSCSGWGAGAGGGGYYGGGSGNDYGAAGGGGSSYIGGVTNGQTIAGNESMPTHDGTSTMTGNTGNGYAKITLVSLN
jgi:hypothetical protein